MFMFFYNIAYKEISLVYLIGPLENKWSLRMVKRKWKSVTQNSYSQRVKLLNLKHSRPMNHYGDGLSLLSTNNTLISLSKTVILLYIISNTEEH